MSLYAIIVYSTVSFLIAMFLAAVLIDWDAIGRKYFPKYFKWAHPFNASQINQGTCRSLVNPFRFVRHSLFCGCSSRCCLRSLSHFVRFASAVWFRSLLHHAWGICAHAGYNSRCSLWPSADAGCGEFTQRFYSNTKAYWHLLPAAIVFDWK